MPLFWRATHGGTVGDNTRLFVAQQNVRKYERLLREVYDTKTREVIEQLLNEAVAERDTAEAEDQLAAATVARNPLPDRAMRWRMKAAELHATADITQNKLARDTYRRLAENYEQLAEDAAARGDHEAKPKTG